MFPFTFPLFLGGSLGFFFAAWSYGFPLVAGERIWPAPAAFAWMLIGVAAGFLPGLHRVSKKILVLIFLLTAGLSLLSIRNLNSSVSWYLAIGLIPCVFWGAAAVGTTLSELLLGFTAAIAIGRGIVLPFSGFLGASLVLAASSAASIVRLKATPDTGKSKPALWSTFALAALVLFNWQRCCIYSSGSTLPAAGFALSVALLLAFSAPLKQFLGPHFQIGPSGAIGASWIAAVALPGLLFPNFYPMGPGWIEGFTFLLVNLLLLLPSVLFLAPAAAERLHWKQVGATLGGVLVAAISTELIGFSWGSALLVLAAIAMSFREKSLRPALGLSALVLLTAFLENQRYWAPADELTMENEREYGNLYSLSKTATGDARVRKNLHQIIASTNAITQGRRHTLLAFRLHPAAKRILIIGGSNPAGASAALEQSPSELTILEPERPLFDFSKWFTSDEAAANKRTRASRITEGAFSHLRSSDHDYDAIVIEYRAPWSEGATAYHSVEFLRSVRERLYPDGIAIQWFMLYQWNEKNFARAVASWREVFGDSVTLWRADLLPDAPVVALIAQGKQDRKAEQESAGGSLPPTHDALLGNLPGLLSLFVADHSGLDQQLGNLKAAPFHAGFPQLELTSTLDRELSGSLISNDYLLRYLASLNPEDGPSYGSLLWTRAVLKARDDRPDWGDDRQNAIKFLGFDPKAEYPDALPKPQQ